MKKEDQIERLIKASIRYADVAERHLAHSEWRVKTMQKAAASARNGDRAEADRLRRSVDATAIVVFDYQGVHQDLVKAVKPFKSLKKYSV